MPDTRRTQAVTDRARIARPHGHDAGPTLRAGGRDQLHVVTIGRPRHDDVDEVRDVPRHGGGIQLMQQLDTRIHSRKILKRQRDELEPPRILTPRQVVVHQIREIVGALDTHPAHVVRLELTDQLTTDVHEPGAPRREQPFLGATSEDVDGERANVQGEGAQSLNGVDDEEDTVVSTGRAERREVHACARREPYPRHGQRSNRPVLYLAPQHLGVEYAVRTLDAPIDDTPFGRELHPRIDVRRKLEVWRDDDVARGERERERSEIDSVARVGRERDLSRGGADQRCDQLARARQRRELQRIRQPMWRRAKAVELGGGVQRPLRERTGRRMIQVDRFGSRRPRELTRPQSVDVVGHEQLTVARCQEGRRPAESPREVCGDRARHATRRQAD